MCTCYFSWSCFLLAGGFSFLYEYEYEYVGVGGVYVYVCKNIGQRFSNHLFFFFHNFLSLLKW